MTLLEIEELRVSFATEQGVLCAVDGVSLTLGRGEVLAVVGESGSGKSVTVMTILGLTRSPNARIGGSVRFDGVELLTASERDLRRVRGAEIAMIFQDPMTALDPVQRVGDQIVEQIRAHERGVRAAQARGRAVELLERAGIPRARERVRAFPHELSGGMRQRAMIAMALSCSPRVLIADEPTTALDVTIQAQILERLRQLGEETGVAIILVTHDLGVVADAADRVAVMYAGRVVEQGTLDELFYDPQHPYAWGLLGSIPRVADGEGEARSRPAWMPGTTSDRRPDDRRRNPLPAIPGSPPSLLDPLTGCRFAPRCPHRFDRCDYEPALEPRVAPEHRDRCWLSPGEKRRLRRVDGQIGLATPGTVIA